MTWHDVARARGFQDLGNARWLAPNGQEVAEGFVAAYCRPERVEVEGMALAAVTVPTKGCRGRTPSAPTPRVATAAYMGSDKEE